MRIPVNIALCLLALTAGNCGKKQPCQPWTPPDTLAWGGAFHLNPSWSNDGTTIAFTVWLRDTLRNLWGDGIALVNPDGSNPRLFLDGIAMDMDPRLPDWSPDGQWLVFVSRGQVWKIQVPSGGNLTKLTNFGNNAFPSWSKNGTKISYEVTRVDTIMGLWIMDSDGNNKKRIYPYGGMPDWYPNESTLIYSGGPPPGGTSESQIWSIDTNGTNNQSLTNFNLINRCPKVSNDGTNILFSSFKEYDYSFKPWIINNEGANLRRLTSVNIEYASLDWSPDGSKIVFGRSDSIKQLAGLWIINADGTGLHQITFPDTSGYWYIE